MRMRALELFNSIIRKVEKSIQTKGTMAKESFIHTVAHTAVERMDTTVSVHRLSAIVFCIYFPIIILSVRRFSYKSLPISLRKYLPVNFIFSASVKLLRRASSLFIPYDDTAITRPPLVTI